MQIDATHSALMDIPVDRIVRNEQNPRLVFRLTELETLQESIRRWGVQVPISVYKKGSQYVLIDGERLWRCSIKLNKKTIPALVQQEPDPLTNMLLMFNIHALREQWDLLTIAVKLPMIMNLLINELGRQPTEGELSDRTGLSRGVIRRCKLLMDLPEKYRGDLLEELKKPKRLQKLTEDFFIEMERALRTVERAMPSSIDDKDRVRDVLIRKYKDETIRDITDFRYLPKIARAERVVEDSKVARSSLLRVFQTNDYSIEDAYKESVSAAYSELGLISRITQLLERLSEVKPKEVDEQLRDLLQRLLQTITKLLSRP